MIESEHWMTPLKNRCGNYVKQRARAGASPIGVTLLSRATTSIAWWHAVECHPERSEGSDLPGTEILRCAQDDMRGWTVSVALKNALALTCLALVFAFL